MDKVKHVLLEGGGGQSGFVLSARSVFVVGVVFHVQSPQAFCFVNKGSFFCLSQQLPISSEAF